MVAITATNSATSSIQASLGRARLEQARSEADQAEANARDLRAQADAAEQQAQQSQQNVRKVASRVQQEEATYAQPRSNSSQEVPAKVQKVIEQMYLATNEKRTLSGNPLKTNSSAPAVVNNQGQRTGRIVNISA
jgi:Skp family chaperone for outer membrane proteins